MMRPMERKARKRPRGLLRQVVHWLLAAFVVLWPAALLFTFVAASHMAESAFDRELSDQVVAIARELAKPGPPDEVADRVRERVRVWPFDSVLVQVSDAQGAVVVADEPMPPLTAADARTAGAIHFREALLGGDLVRIAYQIVPQPAGRGPMIVQVGESMQRRRDLAGGVTAVATGVIAFLGAATLVLVWMGLQRGLAPLETLRAHVEARDPQDLSAIAPEDVPREIAPLVATLNRQLERVRRNLDAQRRFVADAAHQMRTPIAGLKTQAQAAMRGATLQEAHVRLAQIEQSAERLGRLMTQLLALARADDARMQPAARESVDLNGVMREVCSEWADLALAKPVQLGFDAARSPANVEGSALLLRELFGNLLDNAIRYTPEGGDVMVRVETSPSPQVVVEDTGIGIAPADRQLVFEPFYRVLGTGESGSGLGLPIVKAIANLHGATVAIEDRGDEPGTRFRVVFA
jgi:two-component system sensor histidine kinase TctE